MTEFKKVFYIGAIVVAITLVMFPPYISAISDRTIHVFVLKDVDLVINIGRLMLYEGLIFGACLLFSFVSRKK